MAAAPVNAVSRQRAALDLAQHLTRLARRYKAYSEQGIEADDVAADAALRELQASIGELKAQAGTLAMIGGC